MLNLNMSPMVKGILIGVGVSAVGFYAYKRFQYALVRIFRVSSNKK